MLTAEEVARVFLAVCPYNLADPVTVELVTAAPGCTLNGCAAWDKTAGTWRILAAANRPPVDLAECLFHELAHLVHGDTLRGADGMPELAKNRDRMTGRGDVVVNAARAAVSLAVRETSFRAALEKRAVAWAAVELWRWWRTMRSGGADAVRWCVDAERTAGKVDKNLMTLEVEL